MYYCIQALEVLLLEVMELMEAMGNMLWVDKYPSGCSYHNSHSCNYHNSHGCSYHNSHGDDCHYIDFRNALRTDFHSNDMTIQIVLEPYFQPHAKQVV